MARITVEDCVENVPNRFDLVMLAAHRARELNRGYEPVVDQQRAKGPVVALREFASGQLDPKDVVERMLDEQLGRASSGQVEEVDLIALTESEPDVIDLGADHEDERA